MQVEWPGASLPAAQQILPSIWGSGARASAWRTAGPHDLPCLTGNACEAHLRFVWRRSEARVCASESSWQHHMKLCTLRCAQVSLEAPTTSVLLPASSWSPLVTPISQPLCHLHLRGLWTPRGSPQDKLRTGPGRSPRLR